MWASNDREYRWTNTSWTVSPVPVDQIGVYHAARRMQAEEFAKLLRKIGKGLKAVVSAFFAPYKVWRDYQETYRELSELDDRSLADIGISRADIPRVAAGLWVPESRASKLSTKFVQPEPGANTNRPQVAA